MGFCRYDLRCAIRLCFWCAYGQHCRLHQPGNCTDPTHRNLHYVSKDQSGDILFQLIIILQYQRGLYKTQYRSYLMPQLVLLCQVYQFVRCPRWVTCLTCLPTGRGTQRMSKPLNFCLLLMSHPLSPPCLSGRRARRVTSAENSPMFSLTWQSRIRWLNIISSVSF